MMIVRNINFYDFYIFELVKTFEEKLNKWNCLAKIAKTHYASEYIRNTPDIRTCYKLQKNLFFAASIIQNLVLQQLLPTGYLGIPPDVRLFG